MFCFIVLVILVGFYVITVKLIKNDDNLRNTLLFPILILIFVWLFTVFGSYLQHSSDLGTIRAQSAVIEVYETRVSELNDTLKNMIPLSKQTNLLLMNKDTPAASLITALNEANNNLANARVTKADAIVSIAKRKIGPWAVIVKWVGEE